jgi:hypothetical protein
MTAAREFVDFWLENSVHADEQMVARRGREDVLKLTDRLIVAANRQGFTKQQMEAEIGDLYSYIRNSIDNSERRRDSPAEVGRTVGRLRGQI